MFLNKQTDILKWNFYHSTWQNFKKSLYLFTITIIPCVYLHCRPRYSLKYVISEHSDWDLWRQISRKRVYSGSLIPEFSILHCIFFLFTAPLTNDLFAQTEGHWGGDFAIASDIGAVNMTALDGAGGGWAPAAITLLSGCCNMILGHKGSGFQPPLPRNDMKDLRCVSFGSLNVICIYHCDLWISYACIILICNVIYMYPFDLWMLQLNRCITLICEWYMNVSFDLWMSYHMCILYSIHLCFTWQ